MSAQKREAMREEIAFAQAQQIAAHDWTRRGCERALDRYADAVAAPALGLLRLIRDAGGTTTDEGLSCNGRWCAEQARAFLAGYEEAGK